MHCLCGSLQFFFSERSVSLPASWFWITFFYSYVPLYHIFLDPLFLTGENGCCKNCVDSAASARNSGCVGNSRVECLGYVNSPPSSTTVIRTNMHNSKNNNSRSRSPRHCHTGYSNPTRRIISLMALFLHNSNRRAIQDMDIYRRRTSSLPPLFPQLV